MIVPEERRVVNQWIGG